MPPVSGHGLVGAEAEERRHEHFERERLLSRRKRGQINRVDLTFVGTLKKRPIQMGLEAAVTSLDVCPLRLLVTI